MTPEQWIELTRNLGFPAAMCVALLGLTTLVLRSGFGAVHARIDETNRRLGVLAYILGRMAGDGTREEAERFMGTLPPVPATNGKKPA